MPIALQGAYGQSFTRAYGIVKDFLASQARAAVVQRFPQYAAADSLGAIGNERGLIQGVNESSTAYALRLKQAWDAWVFGGTAFGILSQLFSMGYQDVFLMQRGSKFSLNGSGALVITAIGTNKSWNPAYPNWNLSFWSAFSIIVDHPYPAAWLGSSNWTSPIHVGTGSGTLSGFVGIASPDVQLCIKITTGGATGTAQYAVSTDGGITFGSPQTLNSIGNNPVSGTQFTASGTFTSGDRYYVSQVPPTDTSQDAARFRKVLKSWKKASTVCSSISVLKTGKLVGYPIRGLGSSTDGILGGASVTSWTPPAN